MYLGLTHEESYIFVSGDYPNQYFEDLYFGTTINVTDTKTRFGFEIDGNQKQAKIWYRF